MTALVFLDTETLGLNLNDPIWEIAAIRRETDGTETRGSWLVHHHTSGADALPEPFRSDYRRRFNPKLALNPERAADWLNSLLFDRPTIVGAVPNFDTERIAYQLGVSGWHHRLRCVETLTAGKLGRDVGGLSECAEALGIPVVDAHTAMGDVLMVREIWDAVMTNREDDLR